MLKHSGGETIPAPRSPAGLEPLVRSASRYLEILLFFHLTPSISRIFFGDPIFRATGHAVLLKRQRRNIRDLSSLESLVSIRIENVIWLGHAIVCQFYSRTKWESTDASWLADCLTVCTNELQAEPG